MSIDENLKGKFAWELGKTIITVLLFVAFVRFFIVQPFFVIGSSMEPTFKNGDYLFVNEFSYKFIKPRRGDVVVFRHPEEECTAFVNKNWLIKNVVEGPCQSYIKRVIGVPGDKVEITDGSVLINGTKLEENYIEPGIKTLGSQSITLGEKEYYVLGDNRQPNASSDSREWGPLTPKHVVGKVFLKVFNFGNQTNPQLNY